MLARLNQILAFLTEVAGLAAAGLWGWSLSQTTSLRVMATAAAVLALAVPWAWFAAPNSEHRLELPLLLIFKIAVFAASGLALHAANHSIMALVFGISAAIHLALAMALRDV